jgi:hypothetical protein
VPGGCDAQVSVERLEHDVDRLTRGRAGVWIGVEACELGHQERPPDQAGELHERCEHTGGGDEDAERVEDEGDEGDEHGERGQGDGGQREGPPQ